MAIATPTSSPPPPQNLELSSSSPSLSSSPSPSTGSISSSNPDPIPLHDDDANSAQKVHLISISILSSTPVPDNSGNPSNSLNIDLSHFVGQDMLFASFRFDVPSISTTAASPSPSTAGIRDSVTKTEAFSNLIEGIKQKVGKLTKTKSNGSSRAEGRGILLLLCTAGEEEPTHTSSYIISKISTDLNRTKETEISTLIVRDPASLILIAKIAGAAAQSGYNLQQVSRVAELVRSNIGTVSSIGNTRGAGVGEEEGRDGISEKGKEQEVEYGEVVREMLSHLLLSHPSHPERGFLKINSNEPVLLLNLELPRSDPSSDAVASSTITREEIKSLLSTILTHLHNHYTINPVRVYVTDYFSLLSTTLPSPSPSTTTSFSISLLNVVNTDLGGPSMIQLLDRATGVAAWENGKRMAGKEEWESMLGGGGGWSVQGVAGLVMRGWELRGAKGEKDGGDDNDNEIVGAEEIDEEVFGGGRQQQQQQQEHIEVDKTVEAGSEEDGNADLSATTREQEKKDITLQSETGVEQGARKAQDESASAASLPESKTLRTDEMRVGSDKGERDDKAEEATVMANEEKDAMNSGMGEMARDAKAVETTEKSSEASDEEDFEMVDREQSLIDMVFGRGK